MSYSTIQALEVADILSKLRYYAEIIDLISIIPLDKNTILNSVKKTKRLLVLEVGSGFSSIGSEIISIVSNELFSDLRAKPIKMSFQIYQISSSFVSAKLYYNEYDILKTIRKIF